MNIPGLKRGFHWDESTKSLNIYANGVCVERYPETRGRTYYVNKLTGSSTNDGLSWGSAMDQVSTAITASETYRQAGAGSGVSTNDYVRNAIVVQGVVAGASYTKLTAMPSYCTIFGLGAPTTWQMNGVVMFDGNTDSSISTSTQIVGLEMYNMRMQYDGSGKSGWTSTGGIVNSIIEDCGFCLFGSDTGGAALYDSGVFVGNLVKNNMFQTGATGNNTYAIHITSDFWGTAIEGNMFATGGTAIVGLTKANPLCGNSRVNNNWFGGKNGVTSAIGLQVTNTTGFPFVVNNWFSTKITDRMSLGDTGLCMENYEGANATAITT
jgi:hypothetical protein